MANHLFSGAPHSVILQLHPTIMSVAAAIPPPMAKHQTQKTNHFVSRLGGFHWRTGVEVAVEPLEPIPQPLEVALGGSHYSKRECGLESGGFQSVEC